jgi:hypothetical protein
MEMMDTTVVSAIKSAMSQWAFSSPMVVVWMVGILFAFGRWRRSPKVSLLVIVSCGLSLLVTLVMPIVTHLAFTLVRPNVASMCVSLVWACLAAVSSGLLIYAALVDRPERGR